MINGNEEFVLSQLALQRRELLLRFSELSLPLRFVPWLSSEAVMAMMALNIVSCCGLFVPKNEAVSMRMRSDSCQHIGNN